MAITKKSIEKLLGYKIANFITEPVFDKGKVVGISVYVIPITEIERLNIDLTISNNIISSDEQNI